MWAPFRVGAPVAAAQMPIHLCSLACVDAAFSSYLQPLLMDGDVASASGLLTGFDFGICSIMPTHTTNVSEIMAFLAPVEVSEPFSYPFLGSK